MEMTQKIHTVKVAIMSVSLQPLQATFLVPEALRAGLGFLNDEVVARKGFVVMGLGSAKIARLLGARLGCEIDIDFGISWEGGTSKHVLGFQLAVPREEDERAAAIGGPL